MQHKITIDSEANFQRLITAVTAELRRRQVFLVSGTVLSLFGHYYGDNLGTLPTVNIRLLRHYEPEERELLLTLRAEVERVIAHFSATPIACGMVGPNYTGVGGNLDYKSVVQPTNSKTTEGIFLVEEMNSHHMANYLLRCMNGLIELAKHAHKEAGLHYEPPITSVRAIPLEHHSTRKVMIEMIAPEGYTRVSHPLARLWFTDTFFNSPFIKKVASMYKFSVVRV